MPGCPLLSAGSFLFLGSKIKMSALYVRASREQQTRTLEEETQPGRRGNCLNMRRGETAKSPAYRSPCHRSCDLSCLLVYFSPDLLSIKWSCFLFFSCKYKSSCTFWDVCLQSQTNLCTCLVCCFPSTPARFGWWRSWRGCATAAALSATTWLRSTRSISRLGGSRGGLMQMTWLDFKGDLMSDGHMVRQAGRCWSGLFALLTCC